MLSDIEKREKKEVKDKLNEMEEELKVSNCKFLGHTFNSI